MKSTPRWRCVITRRGWRISNIFITTRAWRKLVVIQRRHHLSRQRNALTSVAGRTPKYDAQSAGSGAKFGRIDSDITISGNTLTLTNGLIDTGFSRLTADGEWINNPGNERTSLKGKLRGQKIDAAAEFLVSRRPYGSRHLMWITIYTGVKHRGSQMRRR